MDENEFMLAIIDEMSNDELDTYCDALMEDIKTEERKENNHE